jgi:hypothetical protein
MNSVIYNIFYTGWIEDDGTVPIWCPQYSKIPGLNMILPDNPSPKDFFCWFYNQPILELIAQETNRCIQTMTTIANLLFY